MTEATVSVQGLEHRFSSASDSPPVIDGINLTLEPGEIVMATGPSGSGKTTLLTLIGALRSVQSGSVRVLSNELRGLSKRRLVEVRRQIGFIFQAHNLFDSLSARQNVRLALEVHDLGTMEMNQRADELLDRLGLGHRVTYKPHELSGGQRQRVAVARALANRPPLVLADEPTAALDETSGRVVIDLLRELARSQGTTVLIVTHDPRILDAADRMVNMVDGKVVSNVNVRESLEICEFLQRCPVFATMPPEHLTEVSQQMCIEHYAKGSTVIRQHEEGDKFFFIRAGQVSVLMERDGQERPVAVLKAGEFFGEAALITGEPRSATIRTDTDVALYSLDKASFQKALDSSGTFQEHLRNVFFQRR